MSVRLGRPCTRTHSCTDMHLHRLFTWGTLQQETTRNASSPPSGIRPGLTAPHAEHSGRAERCGRPGAGARPQVPRGPRLPAPRERIPPPAATGGGRRPAARGSGGGPGAGARRGEAGPSAGPRPGPTRQELRHPEAPRSKADPPLQPPRGRAGGRRRAGRRGRPGLTARHRTARRARVGAAAVPGAGGPC